MRHLPHFLSWLFFVFVPMRLCWLWCFHEYEKEQVRDWPVWVLKCRRCAYQTSASISNERAYLVDTL